MVKEDTQMNVLLLLSPRVFSNLPRDVNVSMHQQGQETQFNI